MKIFLFLLLLISASFAKAEVFVMPMEDTSPKEEVLPLNPKDDIAMQPEIDDEMLLGRKISELVRYTICGMIITDISQKNVKPQEILDYENQTGQTLPDKYTIVDHGRKYVCGVYYAGADLAGKGLAVQGALRDLGEVQSLYIKDAQIIQSDRNDFNIKDKKPSAAVISFEEKGVFKKILTSKDKIRSLYNYSDLPLAWEIHNLMQKREDDNLPIRLTFYEDASAVGAKGMAVVVFSLTEKYLLPLKDVKGVSQDIYGIEPDYYFVYR